MGHMADADNIKITIQMSKSPPVLFNSNGLSFVYYKKLFGFISLVATIFASGGCKMREEAGRRRDFSFYFDVVIFSHDSISMRVKSKTLQNSAYKITFNRRDKIFTVLPSPFYSNVTNTRVQCVQQHHSSIQRKNKSVKNRTDAKF